MKNDGFKPTTRRLLLSRRVLFCALLCCLSAATTAVSLPGYLAVVGPAPLRFYVMPKPNPKPFVLPAPKPVPQPAAVSTNGPAPKRASAPAVTQEMIPPTPAPEALAPLQQLAPATPEPVVSPQMLLQFFNKSTNGPNSVVAPLEFAPPRIAAPNQSSATYSTGP